MRKKGLIGSEPDASTTPTIARPIGSSYAMSCALDRKPPSKLYLLFDAQPPRITPYTAMLDRAKT